MLRKLCYILLFAASAASAQNGDSQESPERHKAENIFLEGMKAYLTEDYQEATVQFEQVVKNYTPTAGVYHMLAKANLANENFFAAASAAEQSLNLEKNNTYYEEFLANIYSQQQQYNKAIDLYKKLIKQKPLDINNYLPLADIYITIGEYDQAIKVYDQLEKNIGLEEEISRRKQALYLQQNKVEEAIKEGDKLLETQPLEPQYVLNQAQMLISNKKYTEAEKLLKNFLLKNKDTGEAHVMLAEIYRIENNSVAVKEQLQEAFANKDLPAEIKLKILGTFANLAVSSNNTDQISTAINFAETVAKTNPKEAEAYIHLGDLYTYIGNLKKAQENYLNATKYNKSVFEVWLALIETNLKLQDNEALIRDSQTATEYFPNQAFFWYHYGYANTLKGDFEEAILGLEEAKYLALSNHELKKNVLLLLGDAYQHTQQYTESEMAYDEALKIDPHFAEVLNNASYFLALRKQKLQKALAMSTKLIELMPDHLTFADTHAWVLFQMEEFEKSKAVLEAALAKNNSPSGTILEHYGDILFKIGQKDLALLQWKKAKELGESTTLIDRKISEQQYLE